MKKIVLTSLFCYCCTITAFAQGTTLLKGKIGAYPVIMELNSFDDTVAYARYFYESKRKDIELNGTIGKDGSIAVVCYNNYEQEFDSKSEKLELKKTKNGYAGTWSTTQKTLPVNLYSFSVDSIKNPFSGYHYVGKLKTESPLDYVRMAGLQFIKDSVDKRNGHYLDWYHEKYSNTQLFRLRKEVMTEALEKINEQLQEAQLEYSSNALTCTSPIGETEYYQSIDHIFLNDDVLSVNIFTSYYCGGAHPDFGSSSLNFNLSTGVVLKLDDVLWFGKTKTFEQDSGEEYDYRDSVFAPKIVALLQQLYPEEMKPTDDDDECNYADPEVWEFPNWYFTDKGLYLGATFARYARSCDEPEWSVIPYRIVRKFKNPSLKLKLPE